MSFMPDIWLLVMEEDGTVWICDVADRPRIDAAVSSFLDTGRDSLLHLTPLDGAEVTLRASNVMGWKTESEDTREKWREMMKAFDANPRAPWESEE